MINALIILTNNNNIMSNKINDLYKNEFVLSSASSFIASIVTYPVDAIKTNHQIALYNQKSSVPSVIKNMYAQGGAKSFYKGISGTIITAPVFWGIFFQTKDNIKINTAYPIINNATSSFIASSSASLITNPLYVLKTRFQSSVFQNQSLRSRKQLEDVTKNIILGKHQTSLTIDSSTTSYLSLCKNILHREGFSGFFKGYMSTVTNNTKYCIQFPLYDHINKIISDNPQYNHNNHKKQRIVVSSLISKVISTTLYYPTDLIRTNQRNMTDSVNMWNTVKNIYQTNCMKGFYKGCLVYNMVSVPSFVIMMIAKDYMMA